MATTLKIVALMYIQINIAFTMLIRRHDEGSGMPGVRLNIKLHWADDNEIQTESDYYKLTTSDYRDTTDSLKRSRGIRSVVFRSGETTSNHSCDNIRAIPDELRRSDIIKPNGLDKFYQKYTEAYGIPVIASASVADNALKRACYVVRFMFADNLPIRSEFYRRSGRAAIIGVAENTTDIPEYRCLPKSMNDRTRGLGATNSAPVSTGAEENIMCHCKDKWSDEDIFLHEIAHGIHYLGARYVIGGWHSRLQQQYDNAKRIGLWNNTYAMETPAEYFAEGVQSYFDVNPYIKRPDGIHGLIYTRQRLKQYDPVLYQLIQEVFTCNNTYLKRCVSNRDEELKQELMMDCESNTEIESEENIYHNNERENLLTEMDDAVSLGTCVGECVDDDEMCPYWSLSGECTRNPEYMRVSCQKSCKVCIEKDRDDCADDDTRCPFWAAIGECDRNPSYMRVSCHKSCKICIAHETHECKDGHVDCSYWSSYGECKTNPGYMLVNCPKSCEVCNEIDADVKSTDGYTDIGGEAEALHRTITEIPLTEEVIADKEKIKRDESCDRSECRDLKDGCPCWASAGECRRNPAFMYSNCKMSCDVCIPLDSETENCSDDNDSCHFWWFIGECDKNPSYMHNNCKRSCHIC